MKLDGVEELLQERTEIIRRLEKERYSGRRDDLRRLGDIDAEVASKRVEYLAKHKEFIHREVIIGELPMNVREVRKIVKDKYAHYMELARQANELYHKLLQKKKFGRKLTEDLKGKSQVDEPDDEFIEKVMRY